AGSGLGALLAAFPLPILAGLLATAGVLHLLLLRDLAGRRELAVALLVGGLGFGLNLAWGLAAGLVVWWTPRLVRGLGSTGWRSRLALRSQRQSAAP
ncbi:MAG TPA: hypothetical protein VNJ53_03910, partial [Gaiellaceae bacterium]|nr:hypothetical protein [Gaiellaceae bacterium]